MNITMQAGLRLMFLCLLYFAVIFHVAILLPSVTNAAPLQNAQRQAELDQAVSLDKQAEQYTDQGKYGAAESLHQQALAIRERAFGPDHQSTANSLNNLAELYKRQKKYAEAEPFYKRTLTILEKTPGYNPNLYALLMNYADLLRKMSRVEDAEKLEARAANIRAEIGQK